VTGRCQVWVGENQTWQRPVTTCVCKPEAANTVWSSWWWAVCHSKHVELSINVEIINSITRLHPVGYFYWFIPRCTDPWILNFIANSPTIQDVGLRPLDSWDRGFDTHWWHGFPSLVFVVFYIVSGLYDKLISCTEESYRLCVSRLSSLQQRVSKSSSYVRCDQSSKPSFLLLCLGHFCLY